MREPGVRAGAEAGRVDGAARGLEEKLRQDTGS